MFRLRTAQKRFRNIPFSPSALFQTGDILLWYDPSDLTTLFQDTAGTTPVTADGQSVALQLDKGQWGGKTLEQVLAAQPQLLADPGFDSAPAWTLLQAGVSISGSQLVFDGATSLTNSTVAIPASAPTIVAGKTYEVEWTITAPTGLAVGVRVGGTLGKAYTAPGTYREKIRAAASTIVEVLARNNIGARTGAISGITVKEIPGYHRVQATGTSMPKYKTDGTLHWLLYDGTDDSHATGTVPFGTVTSDGAERRNLLVNPNGFDHVAAWSTSGVVTVAANVAVAPDGTQTADRISTWSTSDGDVGLYQSVTVSPTTVTGSLYVKGEGSDIGKRMNLRLKRIGGTLAIVDLVVTLTDDWQRVSTPFTMLGDNTGVLYTLSGAAGGDAGTRAASCLAWGAQLELGSTATDFQNIGTDEVAVCAGVTKSSDAAQGIVAELSVNTSGNVGSFALIAPGTNATGDYRWRVGGSTNVNNSSAASFAAPVTNVLTAIGDISGDSAILRADGAEIINGSADQGTGNFGSYPLYFGRRGGTTLPFNGREYQTVIRSRLLSAAELSSLETFIAAKTGIIL